MKVAPAPTVELCRCCCCRARRSEPVHLPPAPGVRRPGSHADVHAVRQRHLGEGVHRQADEPQQVLRSVAGARRSKQHRTHSTQPDVMRYDNGNAVESNWRMHNHKCIISWTMVVYDTGMGERMYCRMRVQHSTTDQFGHRIWNHCSS